MIVRAVFIEPAVGVPARAVVAGKAVHPGIAALEIAAMAASTVLGAGLGKTDSVEFAVAFYQPALGWVPALAGVASLTTGSADSALIIFPVAGGTCR